MTDSKMVSRAIVFATFYHNGQLRNFGGAVVEKLVNEPFIFHPLRVMMKMDTDLERVVAVLHDVLKDTEATTEDVEKEFPLGHPDHIDIYNALLAITRLDDEVYGDYIERVMKYPLAVRVKREDITDNITSGGPDAKLPDSLQQHQHQQRLCRWQKTLKRLDKK